ncbi:MAG: fatty acid desaturase, partial [Planctomycetaceae bacterium]
MFPVITKDECLSILEHVQTVGPVRFPWEFAGLLVAPALVVGSLPLLLTDSLTLQSLGVLLMAYAMLLFQLLLHECAHDALFGSRRLNIVVGWLIGLFVLTPFLSYRRGHAMHHTC